MQIRVAIPGDMDEIKSIFHGYISEFNYKPQKVSAALESFVNQGSAVACVVDGKIVGGSAGYVLDSMINDNMIYMVMFLFFKREFRRKYAPKFIDALVPFLKNGGLIESIILAVPEFHNAEKMERFYKIKGFEKLETHMIKYIL